MTLLNAGNASEALTVFNGITGYKDVDNLLKSDENLIAAAVAAAREARLKPFRTVGNYVEFGTYPQTKSGTDSTPIEWLVLDYDAKNNRVLLVSRYGLDAKPYNTSHTSITWEKCTLRAWLNKDFLVKAFTAKEQSAILTTMVDNSNSQGYSKWSTNGGNNTQDKIFLLSYAEANKYLGVTYYSGKNTKARVAPTAYALKQGASTNSSNKTAENTAAGRWWLRSPGDTQNNVALVYSDGSLSSVSVSNRTGVVRPALWLSLDADIF